MIRARVSGAAVAVVLFRFGAAFAQDAAMVEKGKTVFTDQKCKMCHSIAGVGNPKGSLDDVGDKLTPAEMKQWLTNPKEMAEEKTKAER